jgi:putative exporter of polyketide antibiotics
LIDQWYCEKRASKQQLLLVVKQHRKDEQQVIVTMVDSTDLKNSWNCSAQLLVDFTRRIEGCV